MKTKTININEIIYTVVESTDFDLLKSPNHFGLISPKTLKLMLNDNMALQTKKETVIHEVIHAMLWNFDAELSDNENLVNQLAMQLYSFFIKNKELVKELSETEETKRNCRAEGTKGGQRQMANHNL